MQADVEQMSLFLTGRLSWAPSAVGAVTPGDQKQICRDAFDSARPKELGRNFAKGMAVGTRGKLEFMDRPESRLKEGFVDHVQSKLDKLLAANPEANSLLLQWSSHGGVEPQMRLSIECDISWLHIFPYSGRPNTPASRMPQVKQQEISKRSTVLRELAQRKKIQHLDALKDKTLSVLMESEFRGRAEDFTEITTSIPLKTGEIYPLEAYDYSAESLFARD